MNFLYHGDFVHCSLDPISSFSEMLLNEYPCLWLITSVLESGSPKSGFKMPVTDNCVKLIAQ